MKIGLAFLCTLVFILSQSAPFADAKSRHSSIDRYAAHVNARVKKNFNIPESWRLRAYEATARIELDHKGQVLGVAITSPSGNNAFDAAIVQAIKKTKSFGPPPFAGLKAVGLRFNSRY